MGRPHQIRIVAVFTDKPLAGNQLAVVLDAKDIPPKLMQRIAREMNFSETTFILPAADPANAAKVRIFTPVMVLPFAGHPTVGTAWVLADEGLVPKNALEFTLEEGVGPVKVRGVKEDGRVMFWMSHPKLSFGDVFPHAAVASAIGIDDSDIVDDVPAQVASTGNPFLFVALRDGDAVDRAVSDTSRLEKLLKGDRAHGVFLFAAAGADRLYSRMFAPDTGEDPATGSATGPRGGVEVEYRLGQREPRGLLERGAG